MVHLLSQNYTWTPKPPSSAALLGLLGSAWEVPVSRTGLATHYSAHPHTSSTIPTTRKGLAELPLCNQSRWMLWGDRCCGCTTGGGDIALVAPFLERWILHLTIPRTAWPERTAGIGSYILPQLALRAGRRDTCITVLRLDATPGVTESPGEDG